MSDLRCRGRAEDGVWILGFLVSSRREACEPASLQLGIFAIGLVAAAPCDLAPICSFLCDTIPLGPPIDRLCRSPRVGYLWSNELMIATRLPLCFRTLVWSLFPAATSRSLPADPIYSLGTFPVAEAVSVLIHLRPEV